MRDASTVNVTGIMGMLRSALFFGRIGVLITWFMVCCAITLVVLPFRWNDPSLGAFFGRILSWGGHRILNLRVRVEGAEKLLPNQPCVYAINHQSNLDVVVMGCMYPTRTVVIGKKELKWLPLFGWIFAGSGNIMIDRKDKKDSIAGLGVAAQAMRDRGVSIWIFPEGTRNRGLIPLLPFKKGAFHVAIQAQAPIVPIANAPLLSYCDYPHRTWRPAEITIRVLDPIPTKGMTVEDMPLLMEKTRAALLAVIERPKG